MPTIPISPDETKVESRTTTSAGLRDEPGLKFDADKLRLDLLPIRPLEAIGEVLTFGAKKYSERNWEKGFSWSRPFGACLRHLFAFWRGEKYDPETGLPHLAHAACCVLFLLEFSEYSGAGKDDRPVSYPPG